MTGALFKKQMMEVFSWTYQNRKSGKNRSVKGIIGYALLYLLIFGFLGVMFYAAADALCPPLTGVGMGWLYFVIMGMLALFFGVLGSVFNTYASLYRSKDNDLLLAMPVPSTKILLILVFSALLGWLVAVASDRLRHKNVIVVILSLIIFAAYYYCCGHIYTIAQSILANPQAIGNRVRGILFPMYHMGMAAEGNLLSMLIFTAITAAMFAVVFWVLSRNFMRIATSNRGEAKTRYKEKSIAVRSAGRALFQKELRRFLGSASYMLNCGLGIVFMLVSAVALVWKHTLIQETVRGLFSGNQETAFLIAAGAVCLLSAMNDITAPSVSLEGKNLWLVRVFPVSGRQVLMAKLKLHLIFTMIPAAFLILAVEWVLKPTVGFSVLIPVTAALFILVMAEFGLFINLKNPNLQWTSEIVPIKQSVGVMVCLFGSWAFIAALAAGYYLLARVLSPLVYLAGVALLLSALSLALFRWLCDRGTKLFEDL